MYSHVRSSIAVSSRRLRPFARFNKVAHFSGKPTSNKIPETHERSFGQPTVYSHPYLLKKGEVTPGIPATEYEHRRANLMKALPEGSAVISAGYGTRYMSNNVFYTYHQNTDFWYLSGFNEPDSAMILERFGKRI
ncbi:Creatinase/Aminopeptidase P [Phascolomyces articulosus]|uniref:Creatinase/Aminopeptidase P n=1 Tax=Phascolomyces articulosus TaxID=60185 RepID=A0AAD5K106_9FUNG|nr:Creatinase/Aminopeptidase P [Phascolomyces articulosus]